MLRQSSFTSVGSLFVVTLASCGGDDGNGDGGVDAISASCMEATMHSDLSWLQEKVFTPSCSAFVSTDTPDYLEKCCSPPLQAAVKAIDPWVAPISVSRIDGVQQELGGTDDAADDRDRCHRTIEDRADESS
jgi:hypothetical protein